MAAIPWWGWLLALVATIVLVGDAAARSWRARVRREFVAFLRREAPDVEVVAERRSSLDVRLAAGEEGTLRLRHLFTHASKLKADDTAGREAAFAACLAMLREGRDAMFGLPLVAASLRVRAGAPQLVGELVATFGLVLVVASCERARPAAVAYTVGAYIASAYWFTSSTSFANPAVTLARALTDTFTGIRPADVPAFVAAQLVGAGLAGLVAARLFPIRRCVQGAR